MKRLWATGKLVRSCLHIPELNFELEIRKGMKRLVGDTLLRFQASWVYKSLLTNFLQPNSTMFDEITAHKPKNFENSQSLTPITKDGENS